MPNIDDTLAAVLKECNDNGLDAADLLRSALRCEDVGVDHAELISMAIDARRARVHPSAFLCSVAVAQREILEALYPETPFDVAFEKAVREIIDAPIDQSPKVPKTIAGSIQQEGVGALRAPVTLAILEWYGRVHCREGDSDEERDKAGSSLVAMLHPLQSRKFGRPHRGEMSATRLQRISEFRCAVDVRRIWLRFVRSIPKKVVSQFESASLVEFAAEMATGAGLPWSHPRDNAMRFAKRAVREVELLRSETAGGVGRSPRALVPTATRWAVEDWKAEGKELPVAYDPQEPDAAYKEAKKLERAALIRLG